VVGKRNVVNGVHADNARMSQSCADRGAGRIATDATGPHAAGWLGSAPPCIQTTARLRAVALASEPGNRFGEYLGLPAITLKTIVSSPRAGLVELRPPW
jgi:hypothetical protein